MRDDREAHDEQRRDSGRHRDERLGRSRAPNVKPADHRNE